jgi:hypothetical protein
MRRWLAGLSGLSLILGLAAARMARGQDAEPPQTPPAAGREELGPADLTARETAVRAALDGFWTSLSHGDATRLRDEVDLPLVLLEQNPQADKPGRYVVTEATWRDYRRQFPPEPLAEHQARHELRGLRLEWLDAKTCLAVYDLDLEVRDAAAGGHFMSVIVHTDGWKVAVTSLPG